MLRECLDVRKTGEACVCMICFILGILGFFSFLYGVVVMDERCIWVLQVGISVGRLVGSYIFLWMGFVITR